MTEWKRKCEGKDNQEVGLEAAILSWNRNRSLVEPLCAEDGSGLKSCTEATTCTRRSHSLSWVAERSVVRKRNFEKNFGELRSENADMSSRQSWEYHDRRKFKGFCGPQIGAEWDGSSEDLRKQTLMDVRRGTKFFPGKALLERILCLWRAQLVLQSFRNTVLQTDTGEHVHKTKANERTGVKELGKLLPYLRKKGERNVLFLFNQWGVATVY